MNRWLNWIKGIQQELKAFLFFSILFTLFRIVFLIIFQSQLDTTTMDSILMSLWLGFRLSLKTVGSIVLVSLLFATLPSIVSVSYHHLRAHETKANFVCRLLLEKKNHAAVVGFLTTLSECKVRHFVPPLSSL